MSDTSKHIGWCHNAKAEFGIEHVTCCTSCHEDDEADNRGDYPMIHHDDETRGGHWYVCCAVSRAIDEAEKKKEPTR